MALILSIETSTQVCSVALTNNGNLINNKEIWASFSHATHLTVLIDELFEEVKYKISDIDAVAVSCGPGSYTGLRIGVSTAKGICYALNCKLLAINSLKILAWTVINQHNDLYESNDLFCPMIDARRMEVYTEIFDKMLNSKIEIQAKIIDNESFAKTMINNKVIFFGNGSEKCKNTITHPNASFIDNIHPLAKNMGQLAYEKYFNEEFEDVAYFEPFYLKDFVATTPKNKVF
ncbi:MAG: tRNA (adenosine(37)-N6)-threonylcarbamoyltransferase complex dimerization subunit type 1 TsaB [Marinilabiliaceae bacterium]|nr:tRNA (adenosine(37)-N6)-threonylcarbamoyltransferase complex dimerization subunit type 1 TsaB [Marinilabiliaceae bacterium]